MDYFGISETTYNNFIDCLCKNCIYSSRFIKLEQIQYFRSVPAIIESIVSDNELKLGAVEFHKHLLKLIEDVLMNNDDVDLANDLEECVDECLKELIFKTR